MDISCYIREKGGGLIPTNLVPTGLIGSNLTLELKRNKGKKYTPGNGIHWLPSGGYFIFDDRKRVWEAHRHDSRSCIRAAIIKVLGQLNFDGEKLFGSHLWLAHIEINETEYQRATTFWQRSVSITDSPALGQDLALLSPEMAVIWEKRVMPAYRAMMAERDS